jgi:hypothetical protein
LDVGAADPYYETSDAKRDVGALLDMLPEKLRQAIRLVKLEEKSIREDPVAYFTDGRTVRGNQRFATTHAGYENRFATAERLAMSRANPVRYLPQYGGYCAWAVSQGDTASADRANWRIVDVKLYLNYNDEVRRRWERDIPGHIRTANANWPAVLRR